MYAGLPESIVDFLPDHWGIIVFDKWKFQQKILHFILTSVDRLSYMVKRSMESLELEPAYIKKKDAFFIN